MSALSSLIVSIDAFFIGLSLGLQKKCRFLYLFIINIFLFILCMLGFFIAERIYESIPFDPDLVIGLAFISIGSWYIIHYFISKYLNRHNNLNKKDNVSIKTIILVGLVMSVEAMLITMGITFIFLPNSSIIIPITVALAHFGVHKH